MAMTTHVREYGSADPALLREIERHIANPPTTSVVMDIGADMARAILGKYNIENRGLKPHKIRPLVGDIRGGHWVVTGETIKFSKRRLLDGQNRLTACVEAGATIRTHVVFGIPDEAFSIIDTGAPRTAGDVLVCAGYKNAADLSHAVRRLHSWAETPGARSVLTLSPNQVLTLLQTTYPDLVDYMSWGRELQSKTKLPLTRGLTLSYYLSKAAGKAAMTQFMRGWVDGGEVQQAAVLRRRLANMQSLMPGALRANTVYALSLKAMANFIEGKPLDVTTLRFSEDEPFPTLEKRKRTPV